MIVSDVVAPPPPKRLIWIDDNLSDDDVAVDILRKSNWEVEVCNRPELAVGRAEKGDFGYAVVDLLMPGQNGLEVLAGLMDKTPDVRPIVYSGYIAADEVGDYDFFKDHNVPLFDKGQIDGPTFAREIVARHLDAAAPSNRPVEKLAGPNYSVLDLSNADFMRLSQRDRYLILLSARQSLSSEVEKEFREGKVWYLFAGRNKDPITAEDFNAVPPQEQIEAICASLDVPVFQYFQDLAVDDLIWSGSCSVNVSRYPLVGLKSVASDRKRAVHFDTGSAWTFMDIEVLAADFDVTFEESDNLIPIPINGVTVEGFRRTCSFHLVDSNGASPRIKIQVAVPKRWRDCPLHLRPCGPQCERTGDVSAVDPESYGAISDDAGQRFMCKFRWGIVGRNLLLESRLRLLLDGSSQMVHIIEKTETEH